MDGLGPVALVTRRSPVCIYAPSWTLLSLLLWSLLWTTTALADVADRQWQVVYQASQRDEQTPGQHGGGVELHTDVSARAAAELLHEVERFDALVDQYVEPFAALAREIAPELVGRSINAAGNDGLRLLVVARRKDFARLFNPSHFAAFTLPTLQRTTLVVGPMGGSDSLRENLLHEYVHYRLRRDVPGGLPLWFEEGLASYLSRVEFAPGASAQPGGKELVVKLGKWPLLAELQPAVSRRRATSFSHLPMRLEQLVALRSLDGMPRTAVRSFYLTSRALVRYIYSQPELDKGALATSLVLGRPGFPEAVDIDLRRAARSIRKHYSATAPATDRFVLRVPASASLTSADLSPAEVRRSLAEATLIMNPQAAAKLYAKLAQELPDEAWPSVGASQALRLLEQPERAKTRLAAATKLAPENAAVLLEQAATRTSGCILQPHDRCPEAWRSAMLDLRDALDVDPDNYEAVYKLGIAHLYMGQPGEAQGYLQIAWQRVPWSPRVNFFIGESLRLVGDTRARWYLTNAQRWAVSPYYQQVSAAALRLLPGDPDKLLK